MKISFIIPAYNEEAYLKECLESISRLPTGAIEEIIVVDNGSTDRTAEVARTFPNVKVLSEPTKGVAHARQKGLNESTGGLVAFIDAATRVPIAWITRALAAFENDPSVVSVSGPFMYYDFSPRENILAKIYWIFAWWAYLLIRYLAVGSNLMVKRSALAAIGGFDTTIAFYGDDTNIARRLKSQGRVIFDRDLVVYTSGRRLKKDGKLRGASRYALNFFSEVFRHRPATKKYTDIR